MSVRLTRQHQITTVNNTEVTHYPERIIQIGEGNFLRGFVDWMIHRLNAAGQFQGSIVIVAPRPSGHANIERLNEQDGLYTVWVRGVENGKQTDTFEIVSSVSRAIDPYQDWHGFLRCAENRDLNICVSNTTESGIQYEPEDYDPNVPLRTFPAKVTAYLFHRYCFFGGQQGTGLTFLPCELIPQNGERLREVVMRHATEWKLSNQFLDWIQADNRFCNTLVDRIVAGHPNSPDREDAFSAIGYEDSMLTIAEPYHLWAIENGENLKQEWGFQSIGINVRFVDDVTPFSMRKIRILNTAHTAMTGVALLANAPTVRAVMMDPILRVFVAKLVHGELAVSLIGKDESFTIETVESYSQSVLERLSNPYMEHSIQSIMANGLAKIRTRLIPAFEDYVERFHVTPKLLSLSLSALLMCYRVDFQRISNTATIDDDRIVKSLANIWGQTDRGRTIQDVIRELLGFTQAWGQDLNNFRGLATEIEFYVRASQQKDWRGILASVLDEGR